MGLHHLTKVDILSGGTPACPKLVRDYSTLPSHYWNDREIQIWLTLILPVEHSSCRHYTCLHTQRLSEFLVVSFLLCFRPPVSSAKSWSGHSAITLISAGSSGSPPYAVLQAYLVYGGPQRDSPCLRASQSSVRVNLIHLLRVFMMLSYHFLHPGMHRWTECGGVFVPLAAICHDGRTLRTQIQQPDRLFRYFAGYRQCHDRPDRRYSRTTRCCTRKCLSKLDLLQWHTDVTFIHWCWHSSLLQFS